MQYDRLLQANPQDADLLLEIGDQYGRWGLVDEAIAHYQKVADNYIDCSSDVRAHAVLNKMVKLNPKYHPAQLKLARLYQRLGCGDIHVVTALEAALDACLELLTQSFDDESTRALVSVARCYQEIKLEISVDTLNRFKRAREELAAAQRPAEAAQIRTALRELSIPLNIRRLCK